MGAHTYTNRFSQAHISVARGPNGVLAVAILLRTRQGVNVRKIAYLPQERSVADATFGAILVALSEAALARVRSLTVYLDDAQTVAELNRQVRVAPERQSQFVQIRCQCNALGRVRFERARPSQNFASRRLARQTLISRQPVNIEYENALLPLSFGKDLAA